VSDHHPPFRNALAALSPRSVADILYPPTNALGLTPTNSLLSSTDSPLSALQGLNAFAPRNALAAALDAYSPPVLPKPTRRRVFISFQSEDLWVVDLLRQIARSDDFDLDIFDESLKVPFDSTRADYIRSRLLDHIERTSVTICILGATTYQSDWVDWELLKSLEEGNKLILMGVPGATRITPPQIFKQTGAPWHSWEIAFLKREIENAPKPRRHKRP